MTRSSQKRNAVRPAEPSPARGKAADRVAGGAFAGGLVCLGFALAMTLMLVLDHFGRLSLPGCGPGSPCAAAAASWWGKVPGTAWPISFVGLAYFAGLLVAWLASRRGMATALRYLVRLGVALSVMYVVVLIVEGHLCYYCLGAHAANIAFWLLVERSRPKAAATLLPVGVLGAVFLMVSAGLYAAESHKRQLVEQTQEQHRQESVKNIIAATSQKVRTAAAANASDSTTQNPEANQADDAIRPPWTGAFTGRYRWGPEQAKVRIVMITDYQCPDCRRVEGEVMAMLRQQDDVSLSIKQFPMCADCNPHFRNNNFHPNACWAARAAEAAGMLHGNDGFWQMQRWLFDREGSFTDDALPAGLREMGYDPQEFISVMKSPATLELVQSDIEEAIWLGLHFTPMVFINGVELKGVFAHNAVPRTVHQVLATNPPPMTADHDQPQPAVEKYVSDWRDQYVRPMPPDNYPWATGPADAKVQIVMWADYQEKYTAVADRAIRAWMAGRSDVRYTFRHFPFNQACNPVVSRSAHPLACRASAAAEAAGRLGGVEGYWKMHDWLMSHQRQFNDATLRQAATEMGLDADALFRTMTDPDVAAAIEEDAKAAKKQKQSRISMLYRGGIPTIYVNGKVIPRWRLGEKPILDRILNEAAGQ